ncbi:fructose-bisphosphate aldolase [Methanobrevibacter sp. 87.7]|uniref:class II aldolase/adducin family protein n=1 Tax=Methanobrevibacter sp. 87.7 TaxID=387957 RepID=UPI000B50EEC2|nr:class II aldolase/adducin family protein [Methanobrevibacter sp. 87.7]OWT33435.1 fructose-bisphosphate aldolase [Methanobrevibacter sp. 87.7]
MEKIKNDIVQYSKILFERGLVSGKAGNISTKFTKDNKEYVAITPTLKSLGNLKPEDISIVDLDANPINENKPSSEVHMHCDIYKARDDIKSIVHTHSPFATGFAHSDKKIKRYEGFGSIKIPYIDEIEYIKPGTKELAEAAGKTFGENKKRDVIILKHHGIIATGINLFEAESLAEFIEDSAKTQFICEMLNSI